MRFCCCVKQSKKTEKLLNEQLTHAIAKCTLTGVEETVINQPESSPSPHFQQDFLAYCISAVLAALHKIACLSLL